MRKSCMLQLKWSQTKDTQDNVKYIHLYHYVCPRTVLSIGHLSPALCTHSPTLCADSPTLGTHENRREGYISRNMAPRANMHKTKKFDFFILMKSYFIHICPRSHISRDMAVAVIFMCPQGWRINTQG